ncbi:hypothetical protein [Gilliamella sp. App6-5]|uniref:hypothetical protein n=1 Tax=Gilliamella sp. App6-5 TaxID=3120232 RepID=UPI00114747DC|nr:hypothetical protein [Gilliamella apicola]
MTNQVIHGSAPYLTLDGGITKTESLEELLGITLSNNKSYIPQGVSKRLYPNGIIDFSSEINPIELPNKTDTFESVQTIVPMANYPRIDLAELVGKPYNYGKDDDDDEHLSATGSLTIKWQNRKGEDITAEVKAYPNKLLNICDSPYKITLASTHGNLSTQYGIPNTSPLFGASHSYYIKPKIDNPIVCFAQPNLYKQAGDELATHWVRNKGFTVQPFTRPTNNFPTTGANKLFFYLLLGGITPERVIAVNGKTVRGTGTGIILKLSEVTTQNWDGRYPDIDKALKIELIGPNQLSLNTNFTPSEFKLYSDRIGGHLLYNFKIERWYIARPGGVNYTNAQKFCRDLGNGYRVPDINDYTNAIRSDTDFSWTGGIPGRDINHYQRRLSYRDGNRWIGGIFNEWGFTFSGINNYPGTDWDNYNYWAFQSRGNHQYNVDSYNGLINYNYPSNANGRAACVKP